MDDLDAATGPFRGARTGAEQDGADVVELVELDLVVAPDHRVGAELGQVMDQVVDEAVVVVDDEDAHGSSRKDGQLNGNPLLPLLSPSLLLPPE